ncbi:MAG: amidase domain-containing protein [bacterium]|nr:amidase domain-containing protein [bacterium]
MRRISAFLSLVIIFLFPCQVFSYDRVTCQLYLEMYCNVPGYGAGHYNDVKHKGYFNNWNPPAGDGDCANFGSQCLIAGNILLDKAKFHTICPGWTWDKGCITGAEGLRL